MADQLLSKKKKKKPKKKRSKTRDFVHSCAKKMRQKPTTLEVKHIQILHDLLKEQGIKAKVEPQQVEKIGYRFIIIDVVIFVGEKKIAWEIDGPHHSFIKEKDKERDDALRAIGYKTIRTRYLHKDFKIMEILLSVLKP